MQCLRCQGLMIAIQMSDVGQLSVSGWRCLLCGAMTDQGIEANKASHLPCSEPRTPSRVPFRRSYGRPCGKQ